MANDVKNVREDALGSADKRVLGVLNGLRKVGNVSSWALSIAEREQMYVALEHGLIQLRNDLFPVASSDSKLVYSTTRMEDESEEIEVESGEEIEVEAE